MKLTICASSHTYLYPLIANASGYCKEHDHRFLLLNEDQCVDALYTGKADIALISPLHYALSKSELKIIPSYALFAESYTAIASIHFALGNPSLDTIALQTNDYVLQIGYLGLNEKYDIHAVKSIVSNNEDLASILKNNDVAIAWNTDGNSPGALDITEEWSDYNDYPLPIAFWACKDEDSSVNLIELTKQLAADDLPASVTVHDNESMDSDSGRIGTLFYHWNTANSDHISAVQHLLYYHQIIPEIREIYILGS